MMSNPSPRPHITEPEPGLPADWQQWIATNLYLSDFNAAEIIRVLIHHGFSQRIAEAEVQAAMNHPYLQAGRNIQQQLKKRQWLLNTYDKLHRESLYQDAVPRRKNLSRKAFLEEYYSKNLPVVIEDALDNWPALHKWTPASLKARFANVQVQVQFDRETNANFEVESHKHRKMMPFGEYVDLVQAGESNNIYITANNSEINQKALLELYQDVDGLPEYLTVDPANPQGFFWFGPAGTNTPLHHDLTNNFMAQVYGRKRVKLIPSWQIDAVYNHMHCFSEVDPENVNPERFPGFKNVTVLDVTIKPGDLLFIPIGWWHQVRGLDISITMTYTNFVFDNNYVENYKTFNRFY